MKRLQIMLEEEMDEALGRLASERGTSKASLVREALRTWLRPLPPLSADPLSHMIGADDFEPADVDDVVYG